MNLFIKVLKFFAVIGSRQYFHKLDVTGSPAIEKGALLVVANHPNLMLDGVLAISVYKRPLWLTAKSTLFRGLVFGRLLSAFHFVPIFRRQDTADGVVDNTTSFRLVAEKLNQKAAVLIFPEGMSEVGRRLLPVKTGAARIAFQAELESDFTLGLMLQPLGITYLDFGRFRSSASIRVGEPIRVSDYKDLYLADSKAAVKTLSAKIESTLKELTAEIFDSEHAKLAAKIAKLYKSIGTDLDDKSRLSLVAKNLEHQVPLFPEKAAEIGRQIDLYLQFSSSLNLDASESFDSKYGHIFNLLAAPFVTIGVFTHFPILRLISLIMNKQKVSSSQSGSYAVALGFVLFPLWYAALGLASFFTASALGLSIPGYFAFWVVLLLIFSGYCANRYFNHLWLYVFKTFWPGRRSPAEVLQAMRDGLIAELETLRVYQE